MAKKKERKIYHKVCENCGERFTAYRPHAKFCSNSCRAEHWRELHPYLSAKELEQIKKRLNIK